MSTAARPLPLSISEIAARHGLHRTEVRALILTHGVPTARIGTARVVAPADWPRLRGLLKSYQKQKARGAG